MSGGLIDQLREWSPEQVAGLIGRRPDLVQPRAPHDLGQLAQRAQSPRSIDAAIAATTLPENRLLQLIVCCAPDVALGELAAALPEGVGLEDIEAPMASLEASGLVWLHEGRVRCPAMLFQAMPTTLGPPLPELVTTHKVDYLKAALKLVHGALADGSFAGPLAPRASGPDGRPPRKADLVEELRLVLATPGAVQAVLASGPKECREIASVMADGRPVIAVSHPLYFSAYRTYYHEYPTYWLFERGLLLPFHYDRTAVQPREVGVALRGGRPVADLALVPPALAAAMVEPARVDAHAAAQAEQTLDRLADLLQAWEQVPAKTLKSGGLGATVMKQAAATMETDVETAATLVELAQLGGLLEATTVTAKERRTYVHTTTIAPSASASVWLARPAPLRWRQLATAWLRAEYWPSTSGRKNVSQKTVPVLDHQYSPDAPELRGEVLEVLASLPPGEAASVDTLTDAVYWHRPQPWLDTESRPVRSTIVGWIEAEAEFLGIVGEGCLSSFGRAVWSGDQRQAEEAFDAARPEPGTTFTLQADLTATVVGTLERSVSVELRLLADVESKGAATTLRFSDASLRRALDAGRDGEAILAFLEDHATKGVPKPLAYLVSDVARRHGNLQVGPATSLVISEDPAVLADACSHKRTRKLALRLVAPTVAVSPHPPGKVLAGLRDAGFLPVDDGEPETAPAVTLGAGARPAPRSASASGHRRASTEDLSEPFRTKTGSHRRPTPPMTSPAAVAMAETILAGVPEAADAPDDGPVAGRHPPVGGPGALPLVFPHDPTGAWFDDDPPFDDDPFGFDDDGDDDLFRYDDELDDDELDDDELDDEEVASVDELAILRALIAEQPRSRPRRSSRGRRR